MASHDQRPDGTDLQRSLSEQLRVLEQQLNRLSDGGVRLPHPARDPMGHPYAGLPTSLGRPIGLAPLPRFPILGAPDPSSRDEGPRPPPPSRASVVRRHAVVGGCSLLLLSATAIVPSLLHNAAIPSIAPDVLTEAPPSEPASLRTEQFAAHQLGQVGLPAPETAGAAPPSVTRESRAPAGASPTRLTVAEGDLQRLGLPLLVSGGGPSWAGSIVIIDGLPGEARVSHGMRIAPDTWTVGIDDVGHAVLSLPPTTPDRIELSVRVLGANSQELAASALEISVLRDQPAQMSVAPAAIFEPAAAHTDGAPAIEPPLPISRQAVPMPLSRQAVKVERTKRLAPPPKPPVTQQSKPMLAAQPEQPKEISAWVSTVLPSAVPPAPPPAAPVQGWSPFKD